MGSDSQVMWPSNSFARCRRKPSALSREIFQCGLLLQPKCGHQTGIYLNVTLKSPQFWRWYDSIRNDGIECPCLIARWYVVWTLQYHFKDGQWPFFCQMCFMAKPVRLLNDTFTLEPFEIWAKPRFLDVQGAFGVWDAHVGSWVLGAHHHLLGSIDRRCLWPCDLCDKLFRRSCFCPSENFRWFG